MSWKDLPPPPPGPAETKLAPVSMSCNAARTKPPRIGQRRLYLTVRPALLGGAADWFRPGAKVAVQRGRDAHAGRLRIVPGGAFVIFKSGGRLPQPVLSLPWPDDVAPGAQAPTVVDYTLCAGELLVVLPAWAGGPATASAAAPPPAAPPVPAKPAPRPAPPKLATREPPPPPATPAQLRAEDMAPVPATLDEIRTWARRFGIRYDGSNADAVNKERRRLGLPPLVQVEAKGRAA